MAYQPSAYASCFNLNLRFLSDLAVLPFKQRFCNRIADPSGICKRERFSNSPHIQGGTSNKCNDIPTSSYVIDYQTDMLPQGAGAPFAFKGSMIHPVVQFICQLFESRTERSIVSASFTQAFPMSRETRQANFITSQLLHMQPTIRKTCFRKERHLRLKNSMIHRLVQFSLHFSVTIILQRCTNPGTHR